MTREGKSMLAVCSPTFGKFPTYDSFIAYYNKSGIFKVIGLQAKLGRAYPKAEACVDVDQSFLMRGHAPESENQKRGWQYMSADQLKIFLGFSLSFLYPATLLAISLSTEGDDGVAIAV